MQTVLNMKWNKPVLITGRPREWQRIPEQVPSSAPSITAMRPAASAGPWLPAMTNMTCDDDWSPALGAPRPRPSPAGAQFQ
jgi:hypothetical protein